MATRIVGSTYRETGKVKKGQGRIAALLPYPCADRPSTSRMGGMGTLPLKPHFRTVSTRITWRWMIKKLKLKLYRRRLKVFRPAQLVKG